MKLFKTPVRFLQSTNTNTIPMATWRRKSISWWRRPRRRRVWVRCIILDGAWLLWSSFGGFSVSSGSSWFLMSREGSWVRLFFPSLSHGHMAMGFICEWNIGFDSGHGFIKTTAVMYPSSPSVRFCLSWYHVWHWNFLGRLWGPGAFQSCRKSGLHHLWVILPYSSDPEI